MKMKRGDILNYVLSEIWGLVGSQVIVDQVSRVTARNIYSLLMVESELTPVVDNEESDPDNALATLLVGLGVWYGGGSMQDAVNAAATLVAVIEKVTK